MRPAVRNCGSKSHARPVIPSKFDYLHFKQKQKSLDLVEEVNGLITEWPVKLDQLQLVIIFPILRCYSDVGLSWYEFVQNVN